MSCLKGRILRCSFDGAASSALLPVGFFLSISILSTLTHSHFWKPINVNSSFQAVQSQTFRSVFNSIILKNWAIKINICQFGFSRVRFNNNESLCSWPINQPKSSPHESISMCLYVNWKRNKRWKKKLNTHYKFSVDSCKCCNCFKVFLKPFYKIDFWLTICFEFFPSNLIWNFFFLYFFFIRFLCVVAGVAVLSPLCCVCIKLNQWIYASSLHVTNSLRFSNIKYKWKRLCIVLCDTRNGWKIVVRAWS